MNHVIRVSRSGAPPTAISSLPLTGTWCGGLSYVQEKTDAKSKSLRVDKKSPEAALGSGMIVLVSGLSQFFPLVGALLVMAILLDWLIFHRMGWFRANTD